MGKYEAPGETLLERLPGRGSGGACACCGQRSDLFSAFIFKCVSPPELRSRVSPSVSVYRYLDAVTPPPRCSRLVGKVTGWFDETHYEEGQDGNER